MTVIQQGGWLWGTKVEKSTGVLANGATNLFTISTGRVMVTALAGRVTTAVGATVSTCKLTFDPTAAGSNFDLCTAVAIETDAVEQAYYIAGNVVTPGALLVGGTVGQANPIFAQPLMLSPGTILQTLSADPVGGVILWSVIYVALDAGATVVAA